MDYNPNGYCDIGDDVRFPFIQQMQLADKINNETQELTSFLQIDWLIDWLIDQRLNQESSISYLQNNAILLSSDVINPFPSEYGIRGGPSTPSRALRTSGGLWRDEDNDDDDSGDGRRSGKGVWSGGAGDGNCLDSTTNKGSLEKFFKSSSDGRDTRQTLHPSLSKWNRPQSVQRVHTILPARCRRRPLVVVACDNSQHLRRIICRPTTANTNTQSHTYTQTHRNTYIQTHAHTNTHKQSQTQIQARRERFDLELPIRSGTKLWRQRSLIMAAIFRSRV